MLALRRRPALGQSPLLRYWFRHLLQRLFRNPINAFINHARTRRLWVNGMSARVEQNTEGKCAIFGDHAEMENIAMLFRADSIDYDEETGEVQASGNVYFEQFERMKRSGADHLEYNTQDGVGQILRRARHHLSPHRHAARMLTSPNPYYFQGQWAERLKGHYILYDGFLTNCRIPNPWWRLKGPRFNIVPQESAKAYRSVFLLTQVSALLHTVLL